MAEFQPPKVWFVRPQSGAAYKKAVVKLNFLQDYIRDTVRELTDGAQTPTIPKINSSGEFFDLVLAKKYFCRSARLPCTIKSISHQQF